MISNLQEPAQAEQGLGQQSEDLHARQRTEKQSRNEKDSARLFLLSSDEEDIRFPVRPRTRPRSSNVMVSSGLLDLAGIVFPTDEKAKMDSPERVNPLEGIGKTATTFMSFVYSSSLPAVAFVAKELVSVFGEGSHEHQDDAGLRGQRLSPHTPLVTMKANIDSTSERDIGAFVKKTFSRWLEKHSTTSAPPLGFSTDSADSALHPFGKTHLAAPGSLVELDTHSTASASAFEHEGYSTAPGSPIQREALSTVTDQLLDLEMRPMAQVSSGEDRSGRAHQVSNDSGSFDRYRSPRRVDSSGTVTDSSAEKQHRRVDASILSPTKPARSPSGISTEAFQSLKVSEGETVGEEKDVTGSNEGKGRGQNLFKEDVPHPMWASWGMGSAKDDLFAPKMREDKGSKVRDPSCPPRLLKFLLLFFPTLLCIYQTL